jgi:hypothetical protein
MILEILLMQLDASHVSGTDLTYTVEETMAGTRDIERKFTLSYEADKTDFIAAFAYV